MPIEKGTGKTPGAPKVRKTKGRNLPEDAMRGRVRARDPFELIRWLALSQPDPRKALAELVQNSLDAGAGRIHVSRVRERGIVCLKIWDDGEGVIPEMARPEALRYIATNIGHSRKRSLSPEERLALMTQGQYGIGLLGFWSLGQVLEIRTSLPGQKAYRLVLHRDRADFLIEPLRGRLLLDERWTEVVVSDLHAAAIPALLARRAADYLASELRGQLLAREVELIVEDRLSRGKGPKAVPVRPPRFLGERITGIGPVEVPGYPPIRFEIYLAGNSGSVGDRAEPGGLAVYSSGTLVAESFHDLAALSLDHPPWTDARLTGMVDFPGFHVAPGSRRGISIDEAAQSFTQGLTSVEPILAGVLETVDRQRSEELDRTLIRDLQRAFRNFYRQRPRYSLLPVLDETGRGGGQEADEARPGEAGFDADGGGRALVDSTGTASAGEGVVSDPPQETSPGANAPEDGAPGDAGGTVPESGAANSIAPAELFPPGSLASIRILPSPVRVRPLGSRLVRAQPLDASDRIIDRPLRFEWTLTGEVGELRPAPARGVSGGAESDLPAAPVSSLGSGEVLLVAAEGPVSGRLHVRVMEAGREVEAETEVEILEELSGGRGGEGIPEPLFLSQPGSPWRSRMQNGRWEVNAGHHDYRAIADRPTLKLRYLALLFAKEIVLRSHQDPRLEKPLEQLVEVAAYADQNLVGKRRASGKEAPPKR